jgi:single stranded DNA-binding protein
LILILKKERKNMSFAELTAIGNIGKVPEVRYSPDGREFCHFSVAVNEGTGKKDKEGKTIKEATWYNVTCTNSLVNLATSYLKKGDSVFVRGKLKVRKYNGANGMDISLDLFATTIQLIPNSRANDNEHDHSQDSGVEPDVDNTDFNPQQYEQELAQAAISKTGNSGSSTSTNPSTSLNNKATVAAAEPKAK